MTRDEIIEMADEANAEADNVLNMKGEYHPNWHQVRDEIFAKLVEGRTAAKEREACAKFAEDFLTNGRSPLGKSVGNAVRARAQADGGQE